MRTKITQAALERVPLSPDRTATYTDTELRGFMLLVGGTSKRYYVQSLVNGRQVRVKIGDHPTLTARAAREAPRQKIASMRAGTNPNEARRRARARGITLRQALDLHLGAQERSAKTEEGYRYQAEQYLSDWLDRPLCEIGADRTGVRERHRRLTERHGRATADCSMRVLRAVYNRGMREHPELPPNPCANVDFHGTRRRRVEAGSERLREWGKAVLTLSPVMRDLNLFMQVSALVKILPIDETFDAALARFRLMPEQLCDNPFIVEFIGRHSLRRTQDGWVWKFDSEAMGSRRFGEPVREYLQAVGCRAALIFGEKSALVSRETASYMSSLMGPRAPVVEVPEARHHVMLDQPLGFIAALRMLLDSWIRSEPADAAKSGLVDGRGPILPERRAIPRLMRRHLFFTDSGRWLAVDGDSVITNGVDANGWVSLFALAQCRR